MLLFYDTCSLIHKQNEIFEAGDHFYISSITLNELENIKSSGTRDAETKYNARCLLHKLADNKDLYDVILFKKSYLDLISQFDLPDTADTKIIACAYEFYNNANFKYPSDKKYFVTDDLACEAIAKSVGIPILPKFNNPQFEYTGYKEITLSEDLLADFYNNELQTPANKYNLLVNEYLIIKQHDGKVIDKYKWNGEKYIQIPFISFESKMLGKISPKDVYQNVAMDSMKTNQFTILRGPAGSGKDYLGLGYLFSLLEKGTIDKIIIFVNPVATRGAAKLGYLPGSKNDKILDSQIGNFLIGKLGGMEFVYQLIDRDQLILMPISDIRGVDLSGMRAGLYMTEAQNMSIDMMKLALQRIGEDTVVIINGDDEAQVDAPEYAGENNGLRKASKVFRGQDYYGETTLKEIYRSKIAKQAELM